MGKYKYGVLIISTPDRPLPIELCGLELDWVEYDDCESKKREPIEIDYKEKGIDLIRDYPGQVAIGANCLLVIDDKIKQVTIVFIGNSIGIIITE